MTYGDRIAILSESRPEFAVCFFGSMRAGATIVPLDIKLTSHELKGLLDRLHSKSNLSYLAILVKVFEEIKESFDGNILCFLIDHDLQISFLSVHAKLLLHQKIYHPRERSLEEVAVIIYTSGTTGSPKGVMNTVGNLFFQASSIRKMVNPKEGDRFLSILPLNHLLELTHGFLGVLHAGGTIYYSQSLYPKDIIALMKEKRITWHDWRAICSIEL